LELCSLSTHGKVWNQACCQIRVEEIEMISRSSTIHRQFHNI
jgi:hypothetical protein